MSDSAPEKKKVFVYFGSAEINELLCYSLESRFHCEARAFSAATELAPVIKGGGKFDLAVIDFSLEDGMVVLELALAEKIPHVLYHPEGKAPEVRGPKKKVFQEDKLLSGIDEGMAQAGAAPTGQGEDPTQSYTPVSVPHFMRVDPMVADAFVKLSEAKFIKVFHKGATFTAEDRKKYFDDKKIKNFYLRRDEAPAMHKALSLVLENLIRKMPRKVTAVSTAGTAAGVEAIHDLARNLGFTPEVQKLVKSNMDSVLKEMEASPSLAGILANMERDKGKYITSHSQMLAEVSCALAIAMEWGSDTSLKKIAMASLLHDMCLTDHKLCAVKDEAELEKRGAEFTREQIEEYKSHPKRAALLIQGMKEVPADVDKIVYQHHELPKGTGFPENVSHIHIHPLAGTLMMAHDLVDWVIDHPGAIDMPAFIEAYREKYSVGVFKKILKALEGLKL